jgi:hypothetical protein
LFRISLILLAVSATLLDLQVKELDKHREAHREVDVTLRNMEASTVRD